VQGDPKRFASYIGLTQFAIGVIAMVIGPTLTTQLAIRLNWHYAFIFTSLPTVIVGIIIWFILKDIRPAAEKNSGDRGSNAQSLGHDTMKWSDVPGIFAYRNCTLSFIANILVMMGFWGVVSFGTTYWVREGGLTLAQTGYLGTVSGLIGIGWAVIVPIMADRLGRKLSASIFTIFIAACMLTIYMSHGLLEQIVYVVVIGCCGFTSVLFVVIICQESVPPAIAATTSAIGMATGELFGTAIAPRVLGTLGDMYGLKTIFLVGTITSILAFFVTFYLIETRNAKAA
jgi:MFS transporter, ACS family, hexuronate transporter